MVTIDGTPKAKSGGGREFEFTGLSTDEKPAGLYKGLKIANGSSFFELDTKKVLFYDEGGKQWH